MKLAMITPHYGYINRGTESFTEHVSNILIKRGHAVDIYGMGYGDYIRHIKGLRIDEGLGKVWKSIYQRPILRDSLRNLLELSQVYRIGHISYQCAVPLKMRVMTFCGTMARCLVHYSVTR